MTRQEWAHAFIDLLHAKHCDRNAWALVSWIQAEGGAANWNPLNTTQKMPGSTAYNSVGVQEYRSADDGLAATVKTIMQTDPDFGYGPIVARLRRCARPTRTLQAVEDSDWGTGGLALRVLPYVRADYDRYSKMLIAS